MSKLKKLLAYLGIFIVLCGINNNVKPEKNYQILENSEAYASYEDGLIYIVKSEDAKKVVLNPGDILVIDARDKSDPDMKVKSSYEIRDKKKRNAIIDVLQEYEKEFPSAWERTTETMRLEWAVHNLSYDYDFKVDRACDVDFNNADEEVYKSKVLRKVLGA